MKYATHTPTHTHTHIIYPGNSPFFRFCCSHWTDREKAGEREREIERESEGGGEKNGEFGKVLKKAKEGQRGDCRDTEHREGV